MTPIDHLSLSAVSATCTATSYRYQYCYCYCCLYRYLYFAAGGFDDGESAPSVGESHLSYAVRQPLWR